MCDGLKGSDRVDVKVAQGRPPDVVAGRQGGDSAAGLSARARGAAFGAAVTGGPGGVSHQDLHLDLYAADAAESASARQEAGVGGYPGRFKVVRLDL